MSLQKQPTRYRTISIQELRTSMPTVAQNLAMGYGYILIRKSKPLAEIRPISEGRSLSREDALNFFAHPAKTFLLRKKKSAVQIIRDDRR